MKKCSSCQKPKSLNCFHNSASRKDGKHPYCKECRKNKAATSDRLKKYRKEWYARNKESIIDRQKLRYESFKDEIQDYKHEHYLANKEAYKTKAKKYYNANKKDPLFIEQRKITRKRWDCKNKHVVAWRSLLRACLLRLKQKKPKHTEDMLGYSALDLKTHLEMLWLPGMSWDNYGDWHIDHIKEVASFDLDTLPNVVNALSNLRPLWATTRDVNGQTVVGNLNRNKVRRK